MMTLFVYPACDCFNSSKFPHFLILYTCLLIDAQFRRLLMISPTYIFELFAYKAVEMSFKLMFKVLATFVRLFFRRVLIRESKFESNCLSLVYLCSIKGITKNKHGLYSILLRRPDLSSGINEVICLYLIEGGNPYTKLGMGTFLLKSRRVALLIF